MFDIFINGQKVGTNLSEDGVLIALNQLVSQLPRTDRKTVSRDL